MEKYITTTDRTNNSCVEVTRPAELAICVSREPEISSSRALSDGSLASCGVVAKFHKKPFDCDLRGRHPEDCDWLRAKAT
ncbi:hypothetical protein J6590_075078 [Homalodisca vitripennis]|nr:hypothetical protein J6590_075078 [Homalodisca vitripennis]